MTGGGRRICVVTYYFPPSTAVGGARWDAMARHLRAAGHDVTVVTSAAHGGRDEPGVVRAGDLAASKRLRRALRRPELAAPGAAPVITPAPGALAHGIVPDSHLASWVPAALAAVVRGRPFDCLVTTGPPHSAHLLGLALGPARPAWIADFRDGWRFEPLHEWPTGAQTRADAWLEARVARTAQACVGVTRPIADDLADRLGARAAWIPNGWDPGAAAPERPPGDGRQPGWRTLVHTGTLSGPRGRDPRPLLRALAAHNAAPPAGASRIRLVLAGRTTTADEALLRETPLGDGLRHLGLLDRAACVGLQRDADALLLLTGRDRSEATGKLFEYLSSGRPILALAHDNEAARIVADTGTGLLVDPADGAAIERALAELATAGLERHHAPRELERFVYPGPARLLAELVEEAIARRLGA